MKPLKLRKPPYPEVNGSALGCLIQAGHRADSVAATLRGIQAEIGRDIAVTPDDLMAHEFNAMAAENDRDNVLQGAWMTAYHAWELETLEYFAAQHVLNRSEVDWKKGNKELKVLLGKGQKRPSHLDRVRDQLAEFSIIMPAEIIEALNIAKNAINDAKHRKATQVTEAGYQSLIEAIAAFWEVLEQREEFTPPVAVSAS